MLVNSTFINLNFVSDLNVKIVKSCPKFLFAVFKQYLKKKCFVIAFQYMKKCGDVVN